MRYRFWFMPLFTAAGSPIWKNGKRPENLIHMRVDDAIPFCEIFVIPYFLWFAYVSIVVLYLFFKDKQGYIRTCTFLFTGMTVFLLVSTLWPNGHHLRPNIMPRDNIFAAMVAHLYRMDTPDQPLAQHPRI